MIELVMLLLHKGTLFEYFQASRRCWKMLELANWVRVLAVNYSVNQVAVASLLQLVFSEANSGVAANNKHRPLLHLFASTESD